MARDHATRANDKCPRLYVQNSAFSALSQKGGGARPGRGLTTTRDMTADGPKYLTQSGKEKGDPKVALVPDRSNAQDHSPVNIFFAKLSETISIEECDKLIFPARYLKFVKVRIHLYVKIIHAHSP